MMVRQSSDMVPFEYQDRYALPADSQLFDSRDASSFFVYGSGVQRETIDDNFFGQINRKSLF